MIQIMGWLAVLVLALVLAVNAAFMLVSPRAWFRLPDWIRMKGSLSESEYTRGWGAVEVRLAGAAFLAGIVWVLYSLATHEQFLNTRLQVVFRWYVVAIIAAMAVNGLLMLASPRIWARLPGWIKAGGIDSWQDWPVWGAILIRATGIIILGAMAWVLYELF